MKASLFGLDKQNISKTQFWGKNTFNNVFPLSLLCFMEERRILPKYLIFKSGKVEQISITHHELFGVCDDGRLAYTKVYFDIEAIDERYNSYFKTREQRRKIDVVVRDKETLSALRSLEMKLTAVPDNSTVEKPEDHQSAEIVIRQDTIVYLAMSIVKILTTETSIHKDELKSELIGLLKTNREDQISILGLKEVLLGFFSKYEAKQIPIVLQPIWRTKGNSTELLDNCLDVFVWSNFAFSKLFLDSLSSRNKRCGRTLIWLTETIVECIEKGFADIDKIYAVTYGKQNDKSFAVNGNRTFKYLDSKELKMPRIRRNEIDEIILGDGIQQLKPERRFDAALRIGYYLARSK